MDLNEYYKSLSDELAAVKNRVRQLIDDPQWLADGQWKESVLRSVLRRHAPANVGVGSGFVVTPDDATGQIDVLLYDTSKPVLFRDSELVMVTRDACLGVIEVKSRIAGPQALADAFEALSAKARFLQRRHGDVPRRRAPFVGLFAYDWRVRDINDVLSLLEEFAPGRAAADSQEGIINHVALGPSNFIRYWEVDPLERRRQGYDRWHAYEMPDRAFGYFITNAVEAVSTSVTFDPNVWFPREGKELHRTARRRRWTE